MLTLLHPG